MSVAPHLHIGFVEMLVFAFYLVIVGVIFRILEIQFAHTSFGQALSFIY